MEIPKTNNLVLSHYGVKGMKWRIRRFQNKDGTLTPEGKKRASKNNPSSESSSHKSIKDLTDDEIRNRISRLRLEKDYADLMKSTQRNSKGKTFVADILEKSGKNIATQVVTYGLGSAVNMLAGKEIVNPKKGQKDK